MLAYKYRLYPNKSQQKLLWEHANSLNRLYNYFLDQKITTYKATKETISRYTQQKELVNLKKKDKVLQSMHSQVLQQVPLRLDNTYKSFFRNGFGFPKFRACRNFFGITYPQSGYKLEDNKFITKIYGVMKFVKHRDYPGNVAQIQVTCKKNKWYLIVTTDAEYLKPQGPKSSVGIDLGITNIAATSDGTVIKNKTHTKYFDKQINKLKSKRDKNCKKGSKRYKYLTKTINRLYDKKSVKIQDFLHKVSHDLSSNYDTIYCEDLNLKEMSESKITGLNRELRNSQIGRFIHYLSYKTNVIKVNPYNTSKTCNKCGTIKESLPLSIRQFTCDGCGNTDDRDINAAKNIHCLGQAKISRSCIEELTLQEALSFR